MLEQLDYEKKFFTQKDINTLSAYEFKIDDEINQGTLEYFNDFNKVFVANVGRAEGYAKDILKAPFTFTGNEEVQLSGEKIAYAADETALKERWRLYLKYRVLAKYVELKDARDKNKDAKAEKKTDMQLEVDARESVKKNMDVMFKRYHKIDDNASFSIFMNAVTGTEDPHTDYLPPKDKKKFDEMMSGSFFGIGAGLAEEEGKVKITSIITGSPCWKQGELKAGDEIMKVGQGSKEPVDIQGYEIDDVILLIRGDKGTEVRLTVKKADGSIKVIPIIRGEVLREETFAKSAIINSKGGPIGYIYLPEFYANFNDVNGRRCAEDVAIEVQKLKAAGVKGMILDLRYNGGGSLSDVVDMAGLFIDKGPMVQVKSSDAAPMTLKDEVKGTLYDGPMAVMVNLQSASASEIMAAALQDYKRAVIVGSNTYGKGTVQKVASLDEFVDPITRVKMMGNSDASLGSLKITIQKFYRVSGGSTQLKGVVPDVILPDPYDMLDYGERHDKAALKYDEIPAAQYTVVNTGMNTADLAAMSKSRVDANPVFGMITSSAQKMKDKQDDNKYSLNEAAYRKEQEEANATSKKMEELQKKGTPLEITNPKDDMAKINRDSSDVAKNNEWLKNLKKDIYLSETVNIVNDLAKQSSKVNMGTGMK